MGHDVIILGGGTAGLRASVIAAKSGYETALLEPDNLGGTCLNTGCIPTKTLLHSAKRYQQCQNGEKLGLRCNVEPDFSAIMQHQRNIVKNGREQARTSVEQLSNLTRYEERGTFTDAHTVTTPSHTLTAPTIIIATGSHPVTPPIEGLDETGYLTNATVLELQERPDDVIMIGGGYISCEYATFFNALDVNVTMLEARDHILHDIDEDIRNHMQALLEEQGIQVVTGTNVTQVSGTNGEHVTVTDDAQSFEGDTVFVSTGRDPTLDCNLENIGIQHDETGINVNQRLQTSQNHIYAVGDVNGKAPFAHTAKREAKIALENALLDKEKTINHENIPRAIFTDPPIATVGSSTEEETETHTGYYERTGKAKITDSTEGIVKVTANAETGVIEKATILGAQAHNLIHEFSTLLQTERAKLQHVRDAVHIHPTLAEVMDEL